MIHQDFPLTTIHQYVGGELNGFGIGYSSLRFDPERDPFAVKYVFGMDHPASTWEKAVVFDRSILACGFTTREPFGEGVVQVNLGGWPAMHVVLTVQDQRPSRYEMRVMLMQVKQFLADIETAAPIADVQYPNFDKELAELLGGAHE